MDTLFTKHRNTIEPMMLADDRKATLQALHTDAVNKAVNDQKNNIVLDDLPNQQLRKRPSQEGTRHPRTVKIRILQTPRLI